MKTAMKNTAHRDDVIFLLCQPILCLITPCLGCSMFFGPCFFVIGVIAYPMHVQARLATSQFNATLDYDHLGPACVVKSVEYCWRTVSSRGCKNCETKYYCADSYTYRFDAPNASNLTSTQETLRRWNSCPDFDRCACPGEDFWSEFRDKPTDCSTTFHGFANRSYSVNQQVDCWKPVAQPSVAAATNSSFDYACGDALCYKIWDPAIELSNTLATSEVAEFTFLCMLVIGIAGVSAWAFQCIAMCCFPEGAAAKRAGNAREASKRQLTRARSAMGKRPASTSSGSATVVTTVVTPTDVDPVVLAAFARK